MAVWGYSLQNCNLSVAQVRLKVREAIEEVEKHTLIFQEDPQAAKDVLIFALKTQKAVASVLHMRVGFVTINGRTIMTNIGGCWNYVGSIVHELGHKIGLGHELFYDSVDDYVKIDASKSIGSPSSDFDNFYLLKHLAL